MTSKTVLRLAHGAPDELLRLGGSLIAAQSGPVSILAGHFILIYSSSRGELIPLIASEWDQDEPFLAISRDFPEETFRRGLDLLLSIGEGRGKILLLVDDEAVRFMQEIPANLQLAELRRRYFHRSPWPPAAYLEELEKRRLQPEKIFEPNNVRRASSVLPTSTFLFSEHILRSRFRRRVRKKLTEFNGFRLHEDPLTASLILDRPGYFGSTCIIESDGEQACSGPALALMDVLRARSYEHFVWFLPASCREGVTQAVILAVRELDWFKSALLFYETVVPGEASIRLREALFVGELEA